jgi:hypothetical protein
VKQSCFALRFAQRQINNRKNLLLQDTIKTGLKNFPEAMDWYPDSLTVSHEGLPHVQTVKASIQETFLRDLSSGSSPVEIAPVLKTTSSFEWMTIATLSLVVIMAVLWFVMPRHKNLLQQVKQSVKSPKEMVSQKPGFLFSAFFYLNYLIVIVLFAIMLVKQFVHPDIFNEFQIQIILIISLAFVIYSLYKLVFIVFAGFIFKTRTPARLQIRLYINVNNFSGFILLPVLILILSTQIYYLFYFAILIILIINGIKWFQTIAIGKLISQFKLYHLIIYLCTLEIVPVLLLLKLIEKYFS